jgi:hypothetical protein
MEFFFSKGKNWTMKYKKIVKKERLKHEMEMFC